MQWCCSSASALNREQSSGHFLKDCGSTEDPPMTTAESEGASQHQQLFNTFFRNKLGKDTPNFSHTVIKWLLT